MLPELHTALRELILNKGCIDPDQVEVAFDVPTRDWIDGLTRPTLDISLIDMQENASLRHATPQTVVANGQALTRMPPRRVDLRYLVTALTTDAEDSQRLLWRAMVTLLRTPELPPELLPREIRQTIDVPLLLRVAQPDPSLSPLEAWGAFGSEARPAFCLVVTVPVDLEMVFEAPLVLTRATRYDRTDLPGSADTFNEIGGVLRDGTGQPVADASLRVEGRTAAVTTNTAGHFVLRHVPRGTLTLHVDRADGTHARLALEVPSTSYDLHLS